MTTLFGKVWTGYLQSRSFQSISDVLYPSFSANTTEMRIPLYDTRYPAVKANRTMRWKFQI